MREIQSLKINPIKVLDKIAINVTNIR